MLVVVAGGYLGTPRTWGVLRMKVSWCFVLVLLLLVVLRVCTEQHATEGVLLTTYTYMKQHQRQQDRTYALPGGGGIMRVSRSGPWLLAVAACLRCLNCCVVGRGNAYRYMVAQKDTSCRILWDICDDQLRNF
jgi:hypothetical protein